MKQKYTVEVEVPVGVTVKEIQEFIRQAVIHKCGTGNPHNPIAQLRESSVKVTRVFKKQAGGRPKVEVKAPKKQYAKFEGGAKSSM